MKNKWAKTLRWLAFHFKANIEDDNEEKEDQFFRTATLYCEGAANELDRLTEENKQLRECVLRIKRDRYDIEKIFLHLERVKDLIKEQDYV